MKCFVTGGSGFIGTHLIGYLANRGLELKILKHRRPINLNKVDKKTKKIEIIEGDIKNKDLLEKGLNEIDVVFHLAAAMASESISEKKFYEINVIGTKNLLDASLKNNVKRFVHVSSAGVLGTVVGMIADETYPLSPMDSYERTKAEAEKVCREYITKEMDVIIVRPGWVYGPEDKRIYRLIEAIKNGYFFMIGNGENLQTPVYVDDLINGIFLTYEKGKNGEIYNIAGDEILSIKDMILTIYRVLEKESEPVNVPLWLGKICSWLSQNAFKPLGIDIPLNKSSIGFFIKNKPLSIEKAKNHLNYSPKIKFSEGIKNLININQH
ncbi:MAG: NAD-dependent epimerase/dehydratase family protein [Acidobacteriota bacterium]